MGEVSRLRWVPPALAVALGLLALGAVLVDLVGLTVLHQAELGRSVATWLITLAVTLPCTAVGVLLAARRPANPIGWLLLPCYCSARIPPTFTPSWTTGSTTARCRWAG